MSSGLSNAREPRNGKEKNQWLLVTALLLQVFSAFIGRDYPVKDRVQTRFCYKLADDYYRRKKCRSRNGSVW